MSYPKSVDESPSFSLRIKKVLSQHILNLDSSGEGLSNAGRELIKLEDLISEVYYQSGTKGIERQKSDIKFKRDFLKSISGCFSEARVGQFIDSNSSDSNIFDDVNGYFSNLKIDIGTPDNPLLMITNRDPNNFSNLTIESDEYAEFLVLSDLHLDMGCWKKDGSLDVGKLNENLKMFEVFKSVCMEKFPHVKGIIVAGDIFDAFTNISTNVMRVNTKIRDSLVRSIQNFYADRKRNNIESVEMPSFVVGILGNHDFTMGNHFVDCSLRLNKVMANLFGSDAKIIGAGSVRINMGNDFISVVHPDAYDYHVEKSEREVRRTRNLSGVKAPIRMRTYNNMTLFNEFLGLCQKVLDDYTSKHGVEKAKEHFGLVNGEMPTKIFDFVKKQIIMNGEGVDSLYTFYKPFINCDADYIDNEVEKDSLVKVKKVPLFAGSMKYSESDNKILPTKYRGQSTGVFFELNNAGIKSYLDRNEKLKSALGNINPLLLRIDEYMPKAVIVGHFHERLKQCDGLDNTKLSCSSVDFYQKDNVAPDARKGDKHFSAVSMEPVFFGNRALSATNISVRMKKNFIRNLTFTPVQMSLKRTEKGKYILDFYNDDVKTTTYSTRK